MEYIISDTELDLLHIGGISLEKLKSKQPVEEIGSGNIEYISWKPFKENPISKVFSGEPMVIYIKKVNP